VEQFGAEVLAKENWFERKYLFMFVSLDIESVAPAGSTPLIPPLIGHYFWSLAPQQYR
jgi:hypothetical protein